MEENKSEAAVETEELQAEERAGQERLAQLELKLHAILREKYHLYWRCRPVGRQEPSGEDARKLTALRDDAKAVFDQIRLIDKKYRMPSMKMFGEN